MTISTTTNASAPTARTPTMSRFSLSTIVATCLLLVVILNTCCDKQKQQQQQQHNRRSFLHPMTTPAVKSAEPATERKRYLWTESEEEMIEKIKAKLVPQQFDFVDGTSTLAPHQFLHLHHMKTGGTSLDHHMKCAMSRLHLGKKWEVPYYSIHECAEKSFQRCLSNSTATCRAKMDESAIMSFCAPLKHLDTFGWTEDSIKSMTVLRHPVDRVWSMFRFQTKQCYQCMNLTDIYDMIDNNQTNAYPKDSLCLAQLQNHEVTNMLRKDFPDDATEDDKVEEAIHNMKDFFTVIGLTERLTETFELLGEVFPWMAFEIEGVNAVCRLPHDNSSPKNNHCIPDPEGGKNNQHWELPSTPDEETRKAIEAHNQMDLKLYEAAVQYFELQMRAADKGEEA